MVRAALYIRVSTAEQAQEGYSLPAQEVKLREYCAQKGYDVYSVYADEGISAKDMRHRPAVLRMLEDAKNDHFQVVLVWKLTRFSRSLTDLVISCVALEKYDVYLESITEAFDARTSSGRLILGILGSIAQWEREVIGENTKMGMAERAQQGHRTCTYILGYDTIPGGGLKINPAEAGVVSYIFQSYLDCHSIMEVQRKCLSHGYTGKRGTPLSPSAIHSILTRYTYCGYYSHAGQPVEPAPNESFPEIISKDKYNEVQRILSLSPSGRKMKKQLIQIP